MVHIKTVRRLLDELREVKALCMGLGAYEVILI